MAKSEIKELAKKLVSALRELNIRVEKVILYGSTAKDGAKTESDIDLAVVSRNFGKDRVKEGMLLFRIASRIDPRIEPIPISMQSYKHGDWVPLIHEIKVTGVEIKM